jgi:hypothetical protein
MNTDTLKCKLAELMALYMQRLAYGFECDLDKLLAQEWTIRNLIALAEEPCPVDPSVLACINTIDNRIQQDTAINLCNKC